MTIVISDYRNCDCDHSYYGNMTVTTGRSKIVIMALVTMYAPGKGIMTMVIMVTPGSRIMK